MLETAKPAVVGAGVDALAADGGIVRIRTATPDDATALTDLHARSGEQSLYRRFMSHSPVAVRHEVDRIIRPPDGNHVALVAVERGEVIAAGSFEILADRSRAEFALFVDDAQQGRGIGTLLLEHLAVYARRLGVTDLIGEVLPSNGPMLRVATGLGQPLRAEHDLGVVEIHLDTSPASADLLDHRDLGAARRSLAPLFQPGCVAVVGAGRRPGGIGHSILSAIASGGYTGTLYALHPEATGIGEVPAYPSIAAAPRRPDLLVVAVPAPRVAGVVTEAAAAGVPVAVIVSSGFGEEGPDGRARQAEVVRIARASGMRIVGPNCLGFLTTDPTVRLHATFAAPAVPGGLAVASQSGAVGIALLDETARAGLGIASFVSLGNKADVSGNDLLSYWFDDPTVDAVALYLESLGNPRRFARVARTVARRKPVLVVKSGRSITGSRAGASHTAAAAAPDATVDTLFAQAGIVRCDGLRDLVDTARLLAGQPLPAGARVAIVGNAGGINVLAADAADAAGLVVPELPADVSATIRSAGPGVAAAANPVDLGAAATPNAMRAAIEAVAPHVDAIVVAFGATLANDVTGIREAIAEAVDSVAVPVAVVLLGVADPPHHLGHRRAPVYRLPEDAIGALGRIVRYAAWRETPLGNRPDLIGIDVAAARRTVHDALAEGGGWQPPGVASALLGCYGIATVPQWEASDAAGAVGGARTLGMPVVLKSAAPDLVHKSDVGGVRLDLRDERAVADAYRDVAAATGDPRVLVQRQAGRGVELVAGIVHDPLFGSLLMCGLGGVQTELLRDRSLRLVPVTDRDAAGMWRTLRGAPLLTGYRGGAAGDTDAVEDLLLRLGRLAEDLPEVAELDANPVIVTPDGLAVVDVKLRLAEVGAEPDEVLRSLREPA